MAGGHQAARHRDRSGEEQHRERDTEQPEGRRPPVVGPAGSPALPLHDAPPGSAAPIASASTVNVGNSGTSGRTGARTTARTVSPSTATEIEAPSGAARCPAGRPG